MSHSAIDFGYMRHGETRIFRTQACETWVRAFLQGRVASLPGWVQITPMTFTTRHRQPINVVADSQHLLDGPGQYNDQIVFETTGGRTEIRVTARVLPARLSFATVAVWYIPIMVLAFLPVLIGLVDSLRSAGSPAHLPFYIPGLIIAGLLSGSFLALNTLADTGWLERLIPGLGVLLAPIGIVMFMHAMHARTIVQDIGPTVVQGALPAVFSACLAGNRYVSRAGHMGSMAGLGVDRRARGRRRFLCLVELTALDRGTIGGANTRVRAMPGSQAQARVQRDSRRCAPQVGVYAGNRA